MGGSGDERGRNGLDDGWYGVQGEGGEGKSA
jgi:hypothetical protein